MNFTELTCAFYRTIRQTDSISLDSGSLCCETDSVSTAVSRHWLVQGALLRDTDSFRRPSDAIRCVMDLSYSPTGASRVYVGSSQAAMDLLPRVLDTLDTSPDRQSAERPPLPSEPGAFRSVLFGR